MEPHDRTPREGISESQRELGLLIDSNLDYQAEGSQDKADRWQDLSLSSEDVEDSPEAEDIDDLERVA